MKKLITVEVVDNDNQEKILFSDEFETDSIDQTCFNLRQKFGTRVDIKIRYFRDNYSE